MSENDLSLDINMQITGLGQPKNWLTHGWARINQNPAWNPVGGPSTGWNPARLGPLTSLFETEIEFMQKKRQIYALMKNNCISCMIWEEKKEDAMRWIKTFSELAAFHKSGMCWEWYILSLLYSLWDSYQSFKDWKWYKNIEYLFPKPAMWISGYFRESECVNQELCFKKISEFSFS